MKKKKWEPMTIREPRALSQALAARDYQAALEIMSRPRWAQLVGWAVLVLWAMQVIKEVR